MKTLRRFKIFVLILCYDLFLYFTEAAPQEPEINDQYEKTTINENLNNVTESTTNPATVPVHENEVLPRANENTQKDTRINKSKFLHDRISHKTEIAEAFDKSPTLINKICSLVSKPIKHLLDLPKINSVLRNIGICVVNGAMEIIAYYLPPPLMPLIASVAGMVIPFEPVVMLREKMPVTSYRRAFRTAVNSFMGTFDKYKLEDDDNNDPYMTRRFNRRLANDSGENKIFQPNLNESEKNK